jgi:hypothetical protein
MPLSPGLEFLQGFDGFVGCLALWLLTGWRVCWY